MKTNVIKFIKENVGTIILVLIILVILFTVFVFSNSRSMEIMRKNDKELEPFIKVLNLIERDKLQDYKISKIKLKCARELKPEIKLKRQIQIDLVPARSDATARLYGMTGFNSLTGNHEK